MEDNTETKQTTTGTTEPKRRGRPPGSKNKTSANTTSTEPKRRGRPPKAQTESNSTGSKANTAMSKTDSATGALKKWGKPKYGAELANPGDNSMYIRQALVSIDLPPIDISDPKQVEARIQQYFEWCEANDVKPKVVGMANWLGVHRDTLNGWKNGSRRAGQGFSEVVQKYMGLMEELWETYMLEGKVNTVAGIFLGKIMFGYKEPTEVIVSTGNPYGENQKAPEQLEEYLNTVDAD